MNVSVRNENLDVLKFLMSIMIVSIHTNSLMDVSLFGNYALNNGLFRAAVPMFFLISGFFFYNVIVSSQFNRWMIRLVKLYLFWMLVYIPLWFRPESYDVEGVLEFTLLNLFQGYYHLWFVVSLIFSGVYTYIIVKIVDVKYFPLIAFLLYSLGVIYQYFYNYSDVLSTPPQVAVRGGLFFGFPFFLLGVFICKFKPSFNSNLLYLAIGCSLFFLFIETTVNFINLGYVNFDLLWGLLFLVPFFFIFVLNSDCSINGFSKISAYGAAIFFSHIAVRSVISRLVSFDNSFVYFLTVLAATLIFSFLIVKMRKVMPWIV